MGKREVTPLHRWGECDEYVGEDDGSVGVDRGDDDGPRRRSGATGSKGERPPFFLFFLDLLPRWEKGFSSGPWLPWRQRGGSPSEIGSLSLCFLLFLRSQVLAFHRFLNFQRSVTPIGLKFGHDFYPYISFLAEKKRPPTAVRGGHEGPGRI